MCQYNYLLISKNFDIIFFNELNIFSHFRIELWQHFYNQLLIMYIFVNSGNTMNGSFQWTDAEFRIDQVNIVTMNILELDMQHR